MKIDRQTNKGQREVDSVKNPLLRVEEGRTAATVGDFRMIIIRSGISSSKRKKIKGQQYRDNLL